MKKAIYVAILFVSYSMFSQKKASSDSIEVPIEVKNSFSNEFKGLTPIWTTDFKGFDNPSQRFIATFKNNETIFAAYYTIEGVQRVLEQSIDIKKLPKSITNYLKENYPTYKINEAVVVKRDNVKTYEVGIGNFVKFFDVQFDANGDFLQMNEKIKT